MTDFSKDFNLDFRQETMDIILQLIGQKSAQQ